MAAYHGAGGDQVLVGTTDISGSAVFSNSNNVSFGVNAGTITASAAAQTFLGALVVGAATQSAGSVVISNGSGVSWGLNASTLTASIAAGATATGNFGAVAAEGSPATSGTVSFSNSPTVTFGMNGQTITASAAGGGAAAPNMSFWANTLANGVGLFGNLALSGFPVKPLFYPINHLRPMPGAMTIETMGFMVSGNTTISTVAAHTWSLSIGMYVLSNSTRLSLINSVSTSYGLAVSDANSFQTVYAGQRYMTFASSQWSAAPVVTANGSYWMACIFSANGGPNIQVPASAEINMVGGYGLVGSLVTNKPVIPFFGVYSTSSGALPASVSAGEAVSTNSNYAGAPINVFANGISWLP